MEKKDWENAYKLACLSIARNDFLVLGTEALKEQEFGIAEKCFLRINESGFLSILNKHKNLRQPA